MNPQAVASPRRVDAVRTLPTQRDVAEFIGMDESGVTRAVARLDITPQMWGRREKHLRVEDVLAIAAQANRASLEEVGGILLEWAERNHPEVVDAFTSAIDQYFAALPEPQARLPEEMVSDIIEFAASLPIENEVIA